MMTRNERGFTLVEIIIAIAIAGIIASIAIPNYINYQYRASIKTDIATCAELIRAGRIYTITNHGEAATIRNLLSEGYFPDNNSETEIIPLTSADSFSINYDNSENEYSASFTTDSHIVGKYGGKTYTVSEGEELPHVK